MARDLYTLAIPALRFNLSFQKMPGFTLPSGLKINCFENLFTAQKNKKPTKP